jgi:hypothetical protein
MVLPPSCVIAGFAASTCDKSRTEPRMLRYVFASAKDSLRDWTATTSTFRNAAGDFIHPDVGYP